MRALVVVTPKLVVNDPQGNTVQQGLNFLGFTEVSRVRVGKYLELELSETDRTLASSRVEQMCQQLLANHVIEDYRFELEADPAP
ncbi:MAG: phosphoribosylformylglycinamidine synthase subunit PurS [Candidatus Dormibacteraceae bacterium]